MHDACPRLPVPRRDRLRPGCTPGSGCRCSGGTWCSQIWRWRRYPRSARTVAVAAGHAPGSSAAGFGYALLFTAIGAGLLTLSAASSRAAFSQEAFIGILYVVATAATVLVVDRSPQGAEHVKKMLVGAILRSRRTTC